MIYMLSHDLVIECWTADWLNSNTKSHLWFATLIGEPTKRGLRLTLPRGRRYFSPGDCPHPRISQIYRWYSQS